jgi:hypothetical protein
MIKFLRVRQRFEQHQERSLNLEGKDFWLAIARLVVMDKNAAVKNKTAYVTQSVTKVCLVRTNKLKV